MPEKMRRAWAFAPGRSSNLARATHKQNKSSGETGEVGRNDIARLGRDARAQHGKRFARGLPATGLHRRDRGVSRARNRASSGAAPKRTSPSRASSSAIVGDELARRCIDTRKPVATNKLKHISGGAIACKLVAVPLIARGGPAGALIIFNRPDEPSFDEFTVRRLGRFARLLARSATQDLDSLTGLLSWDGFKTRVESWQRTSAAAARWCRCCTATSIACISSTTWPASPKAIA